MKLEHTILIVGVIATILAVPIAQVAHHRANLLKLEKAENRHLRIQLDTKARQLQLVKLQQQRIITQRLLQQQQREVKQKQLEAVAKARLRAKLAAYTTPRCEDYRHLVARYKWNVRIAMAVMRAESGCRAITPNNASLNYDHIADHGLFQLHGINVTDPAENIRIAYTLKYKTQGWRAWNAYKNGSYLRYL